MGTDHVRQGTGTDRSNESRHRRKKWGLLLEPTSTTPWSVFVKRVLVIIAAVGAFGCGVPDPPPLQPPEKPTAQALFEQGTLFARAGDVVRAEEYFVSAMNEGYPEERVLPPLLRVCVEAHRLTAALAYAEPYLAREPN